MNKEYSNSKELSTEYLITRHSLKPESGVVGSEKYPGITEEGVELARERGVDLLANIEKSRPGTIVWFGGVTNEIRTCSTMQVYIDSIKEMIVQNETLDIVVLGRKEITQERKFGPTRSIEQLTKIIIEKPEYKFVIGIPLLIKELTIRRWFDEEGRPKEYALGLLKRAGGNQAKIIELWLQDSMEGKSSPTAQEQAEEFSKGLVRMEEFIKKFIHDRDVKIVVVGQTSELVAYLVNTIPEQDLQEAYRASGNKPFEETEMMIVSKSGDKIKVSFRGHEYEKSHR